MIMKMNLVQQNLTEQYLVTINWKEKDTNTIEIIRGVRNHYKTKNYNINDIGDLNILLHKEKEWIIEQIANESFNLCTEYVRNYIKFI